METSSRPSCIWERSVIPKPCGGLKISMPKMIQGDPVAEITLFNKGYILSISRF
jgi:hypothetical protein